MYLASVPVLRTMEAFLSFDNACEALRELSNRSRNLLFSTSTELLHQHNLLKLTPASASPAPGWRNVAPRFLSRLRTIMERRRVPKGIIDSLFASGKAAPEQGELLKRS